MLPSGEQIAIAHGDQRAVITEVGATLRTYAKGGVAVIEGFDGEECPRAPAVRCSTPGLTGLATGSGPFRTALRTRPLTTWSTRPRSMVSCGGVPFASIR